jgi:hypothetical protein
MGQKEGNTGIRAIGREMRSGGIVVVMGTGMLDNATGTVPPAAGIEVAAMLLVVMGAAGGTVSTGQDSTRWNIRAHSSH